MARKQIPVEQPSLQSPLQADDVADDYVRWLHVSPTPHHAVQQAQRRLQAQGFTELFAADAWKVEPGQRLYVVHPDGKSLIGLVIGRKPPTETGFALIGAHTDSPDLRLRPNPLLESAGTVQLATHFHGGLIRRSWLDRPLALAGCVYTVLRNKKGIPVFNPVTGQPIVTRQLVHIDAPVAVIPDLAIHLDREKNDKGAINPATALNAVIGSGLVDSGEIQALLSHQAGIDLAKADGFDLHLVSHAPPLRTGVDRSMVTGPRHDDLAMVYCGLRAMLDSVDVDESPVRTRVIAFFDAEETGSQTASGAGSNFLRDTLIRVAARHSKASVRDDPQQAFANTFCISADMAHAVHPNFADLHDKLHAPRINQGVVIKVNASDRYATTGHTSAVFLGLCETAGVTVQDYVVRQDMACGTTIGPITAANLGVQVVDVGCPMWAMHSTAETLGCSDLTAMVAAMRTFLTGGVG